MKVTLDLPETVARQLLELPETERCLVLQKALAFRNKLENLQMTHGCSVDFHLLDLETITHLPLVDQLALVREHVRFQVPNATLFIEAMEAIEAELRSNEAAPEK